MPAASSFAASQASAIFRPSAFSGTLPYSPLGGVIMRYRQSSVTTETQCPVRSTGADALAPLPAAGWPAPRPRWAWRVLGSANITNAAIAARVPAIPRFMSPPYTLLREASIHRLNEHLRCPGSGRRTVASIEIPRRPRGLHLLKGHTAFDVVLNAVANHHEHV